MHLTYRSFWSLILTSWKFFRYKGYYNVVTQISAVWFSSVPLAILVIKRLFFCLACWFLSSFIFSPHSNFEILTSNAIDDKYHPEEVQGFFNPTSVSIMSLSGNYSFRYWTFCGWTSDKPERICFQLYSSSAGKDLNSFLQLVDKMQHLTMFFFLFLWQAFIVLSCLISVSVNFSTFLVIGKTSPVTYQVLGHLKTCLVLAFGYVLLRDPFSWRNILGILIAIVGMVLYSYWCSIESQQKASAEAAQISQVPTPLSLSLSLINAISIHVWFAYYLFLCIKAKETESDPLLNAENGGGLLAEGGGARAPGWNSNKDLHA